MKNYTAIAPNGYLHGPFTKKDALRMACQNTTGNWIIAKLVPVAEITRNTVVRLVGVSK